MLFNSFEYFILLSVTCILFYTTRNQGIKKMTLLISSYIFYFSWSKLFLLLIIATTLITYASTLAKKNRSLYINFAISFNVLSLLIFKYLLYFKGYEDFLTSNFSIKTILVPIGISFYTFQIISFLIDSKRQPDPIFKNLLDFSLFVCFFPQLIAGPIEKSKTFSKQLTELSLKLENVKIPVLLILWGLFKKIVIVNILFQFISLFRGSDLLGVSVIELVLLGVVVRYFIYSDFSSYTDIAIGSAKLFGINLTNNFKNPLFSKNMIEYWNHWHITLGNWIREYIFYPLIFSQNKFNQYLQRKVDRKIIIALYILISFFVIGLWHGPSKNFIYYGLANGFFILITALIHKKLSKLPPAIQVLLNLTIPISITSLLFISTDISSLYKLIKLSMINDFWSLQNLLTSRQTLLLTSKALCSMTILSLFDYFNEENQLLTKISKTSQFNLFLCLFFYLFLIFTFGDFNSREFVYIQF